MTTRPVRDLPKRVRKARTAEQTRRYALARQRAYGDLYRDHYDEFRDLYEMHLAALWAERGPLPGDNGQ